MSTASLSAPVPVEENKSACDSVYKYTKRNGEDVLCWKPATRPFKFSYTMKNAVLGWIFKTMPDRNSVLMSIDLKYHKEASKLIDDTVSRLKESREVFPEEMRDSITEDSYVNDFAVKDDTRHRLNIWINKFRRDVTENCVGGYVKLLMQDKDIYMNDVGEFEDFIKNKKSDVQVDIFFEAELNTSTGQWTTRPQVYSINFMTPPYTDMSIMNFARMSLEDQKLFLTNAVEQSIINNNLGKENVKVLSFYFRNQYFEFPSINFKSDNENHLSGRSFEPRIWIGKKVKYDENSTERESINIYASDPIMAFMNGVKSIIEEKIDDFATVINTSKRPTTGSKKSVKKVEITGIRLPLKTHTDASDGSVVKILNVKQPYEDDSQDKLWHKIPSGLSYTLKYPKIALSKLWFDEKSKELVLQMMLSKYTTVDVTGQQSIYQYCE